MAQLFGTNIDLNLNELQNHVLHKLAAAPTSVEGRMYWDTTALKHAYLYDGTAWRALTFAGTATPVAISVGATAVVGTSLNAAREDHVHAAPNVATTSVSGFMSSADKTKLDAATASPTVSTLVLRDAAGRFQAVDPSAAQDVATKAYVDAQSQGLDIKASVRVATVAAGTLATSFANGQSVDGVTLVTGDRILIKNQAAPAENGIYTVNASGAPTRAVDMDAWTEVPGGFTFIEVGTTLGDSGWVCTSDQGGTLGTTAITFAQFSGAGTITASGGITKTGNDLALTTMAAHTFKGNNTGSTAAPLDLTIAQMQAELQGAAILPAHTGDVTSSAGSAALTIANGAVTLAKQANLAANSIIGNNTGSPATPLALTVTQTTAMLNVATTVDKGLLSAADKIKLDGIAASANNYAHPNHSGDVTSVGDGAQTIAAGAVTNAKMANMVADTIKGRANAAGTGAPQDLTAAQVRTIIGVSGQYAATFGDGTAVSFAIAHNLGTKDVTVQVYRVASPYETIWCDVERTDTNTVTLRFTAAPTASQYRVVVK